MTTYIRFVNEGEVVADREITELLRLGLIARTDYPEKYIVLDPEGIRWELDRRRGYHYNIIHVDF